MADDESSIQLTEREREILRGVVEGKTNSQIAEEVLVSVATVKFHLGRLCKKLGQSNRTGLATYAMREGLLERNRSRE